MTDSTGVYPGMWLGGRFISNPVNLWRPGAKKGLHHTLAVCKR